jgi:hypothetical protein
MEINEKTKKYHTIITVPQSNEKNLQRGKIDTADTQKKAIKCKISCNILVKYMIDLLKIENITQSTKMSLIYRCNVNITTASCLLRIRSIAFSICEALNNVLL